MSTGLHLVPPRPSDRRAILDLFETALCAEPDYLPQVSAGLVELASWFDAKPADWARLAYGGRELVGHVSVRRNTRLPSGDPVPAGTGWEVGRLVVLPAARRTRVASVLVNGAASVFGAGAWATCVAHGPSHRLFGHLGWSDFAPVSWADDPAPGVAVRYLERP